MRTLFGGKHTLLKDPTKEKYEVLRKLLTKFDFWYDIFSVYQLGQTFQVNRPLGFLVNEVQWKTFEEWVIEIIGVKKKITVLFTDNHKIEFDDNGARVIPLMDWKGSYRMKPETFDEIVKTWENHKNGL